MRVSIEEAQRLLCQGEVVAVPTETVYGLAAAIDRPEAVKKIYTLKRRPPDNPLIIHLSHAEQIRPFVIGYPEHFFELANRFWPGPLTLVVPINELTIPSIVRAGLSTAAFRVPGHVMARELITLAGPLVMPSANLSGKPSATDAFHVENDFGKDFPVLDGGASGHGLESTILIFNDGKWLLGRLGAISSSAFESILGYEPRRYSMAAAEGRVTLEEVPLCPGQKYRHYSPECKLYLVESEVGEWDYSVVIGYLGRSYPKSRRVITFGAIEEPEVVARNLYRVLRELDEAGIEEAWVDMNIPHVGLWQSIRERLNKAAYI